MSLFVGVLLVIAACSATKPNSSLKETPSISPTTAAAVRATADAKTTSTIVAQSTPTPTGYDSLGDTCNLLNTYDLASFFPSHAETVLPKPQVNLVDHPIFAVSKASGTETTCTYYTFHLPGSHNEVVLQVNYWLDIPVSTNQDWNQAWNTANSTNAQMIASIADGAFYKDNRLSFKKGNIYVTIEATETDWNMNIPSGMKEQLTAERQLARDMLTHW